MEACNPYDLTPPTYITADCFESFHHSALRNVLVVSCLTGLQRSSGQFGQQTIKLLVLLVDARRIGAVVVLLPTEQRQVPRPAGEMR